MRRISGNAFAEYHKVSAEVLLEQIEQGFDARRDPSGNKWRPRKGSYAHPMLEKTGAMRRSIYARAGRSEVRFGASARSRKGYPYPEVHQYGSKRVAQRQFLPEGELPRGYVTKLSAALWRKVRNRWGD